MKNEELGRARVFMKVMVVDERKELIQEPYVVRLGGLDVGAIFAGSAGARPLGVRLRRGGRVLSRIG
ncbi:MAG: hypothetical protein QN142_09920 [Armatimonadota bacterium]|nr:hypothetical protein [Armatimonadota bacterium]MDR7388062.1 hypothetical protein [Armatimonadota bacterium]MDR7395139.1 hypothetical protein [Armatimonadota bacterium]MDR7397365.1 hypothetical protein [Armatimonadota bacterium]MDR7399605.1 hypothetical protein [Armatimonadota bacterium]